MKKFVFEYWFRRRFFEKDFDRITIIAKTRDQAIKTFKNTIKHYTFKIISETELKGEIVT